MMRLVLLTVLTLATLDFAIVEAGKRCGRKVPGYCLYCICVASSNCIQPDPLCDKAKKPSCGQFKITEDYWTDASAKKGGAALGGGWMKCAASFKCSKEAVHWYMKNYATKKRLGRKPTCQDFARIHGGGPDGYKQPGTLKFWNDVYSCIISVV